MIDSSFVAVSSRSISRLKTEMMSKLEDYQKELQPTLDAVAANLNIVAGADETFLGLYIIKTIHAKARRAKAYPDFIFFTKVPK